MTDGRNRGCRRGPAKARGRVAVLLIVLAALTAASGAGCDAGGAGSPTAPEPRASVTAFSQQLDDRVPRLMDRYDIPGVSIAVVENGELAWADRKSVV